MPNCGWPDCGILLKFLLLSFDTDVELGLLRCVHTSVRFDAIIEIRRCGSPCFPGLGCRCQFPSRPSPGGPFTRRLNCGTGDSPCDMLGSSHFVGVGCLESSWLAQWCSRAWAATNTITTTAMAAHRLRPCQAVCRPDRCAMFQSNPSKVEPIWRVGRPARPSSAAAPPVIHRAWLSANPANRRVFPGADPIRTAAVWPRPVCRDRPTTRRSIADEHRAISARLGPFPAQPLNRIFGVLRLGNRSGVESRATPALANCERKTGHRARRRLKAATAPVRLAMRKAHR